MVLHAVYWDSSALIKRYFEEEGSDTVQNLFQKGQAHFTATIAHAEILSTIHRLRREGRLSQQELESVRQEFLLDWRGFRTLTYGREVQEVAESIITMCALRGADLIHLASAMRLSQDGITSSLATFDQRLRTAAADSGLEIVGIE